LVRDILPQIAGIMIASGTGRMAIGIGRREFIATLGGATIAWPLVARAAADAVGSRASLDQIGRCQSDLSFSGSDPAVSRTSFEDFEVEPFLAFEMIIDGGLIDASFDDDVPHARTLEAFLREQMDGGLDNGTASVFSRSGHGFPIQNDCLN
jgi:hypothetical protein